MFRFQAETRCRDVIEISFAPLVLVYLSPLGKCHLLKKLFNPLQIMRGEGEATMCAAQHLQRCGICKLLSDSVEMSNSMLVFFYLFFKLLKYFFLFPEENQ